MNQVKLNLMVRVVFRRITAGETLDEVLASYPGLSGEECLQIRSAVGDLTA